MFARRQTREMDATNMQDVPTPPDMEEMPAWLIDAAMHLQAQAPPTTVHVDEP